MGGAPRWAVSAAAVVLVMTLGGTGMVAASQDSMPDQPLYPVKRAVEETCLMLAWNAESKAQLHAKFADRRVAEIAVLSKKGNAQRVISLTTDLDRHLRSVQRSAFPEAVPARPLLLLIAISGGDVQATPPPIVPAIATPLTGQGDHTEEGRAKPEPLPPKTWQVKLTLRRELVAGFQRQEETLSRFIQASRGPDRQRLQQTLHILREHRKALFVVLEEGFEPNLQATPTLP